MRTLKILAVVLVAMAISAAAVWLYIGHAAERKWAAAQERIRQLAADYSVLPPMPSTPGSKELQIHFVAAIKTAARRSVQSKNVVEDHDIYGTKGLLDTLEDAKDFLDRLHQGARLCAASPSDFPPGWRGEWDTPTLQHMMGCCVIRARQLRENSKPSEAAEMLLDSLQLARFWAASLKGGGRWELLRSFDVSVRELRRLLAYESLSRKQLEAMERELEPLEAALRSPTEVVESLLAKWGERLLTADEETVMEHATFRWRYLLPSSLMKAEAIEFCEAYLRQLRAAQGQTYLDMNLVYEHMEERRRESSNPLLLPEYALPLIIEWNEFGEMADLRILRLAARYRATGEVLPLKDPYGDAYRRTRTETRMKFWSVGLDGKDDGGDPDKDRVLEVDHPKPE